jgi:hypothetical protein
MSWKNNSLMWWQIGNTLYKISDHNRSPLSEDTERIDNKKRMLDGTLRRYSVTKKRTWTCSWDNLPSKQSISGMKTADNGLYGEQMEALHNSTDGEFRMILRRGTARNVQTFPNVPSTQLPYDDGTFYATNVMITEFSKETVKRGLNTDLWNVSITLEEV